MLIQTIGDTAAPAGHRPAPTASARTPGATPGAFGALMTELERQARPAPVPQADSAETASEAAVEEDAEGSLNDTPEQAASDNAEQQDSAGHEAADHGPMPDADDEVQLANHIVPEGPEVAASPANGAISERNAPAHGAQQSIAGADTAASGAARTGTEGALAAAQPGTAGGRGESTPAAAASPVPAATNTDGDAAALTRAPVRAGAEPNGQPVQAPNPTATPAATPVTAQGTPPGVRIAASSAEAGIAAPPANHDPARLVQPGAAPGAQPAQAASPAGDSPVQGAMSSLAQSVRERIAAQNDRGEASMRGSWASATGHGGAGVALPAGMMPTTPTAYLPSAALAAVSGELARSAASFTSLPGSAPGGGEAAPLNGFAEALYPAGALPMGDPAAPNAPAGTLPAPGSPAAAEMARSIAQQMGAQISADGKGRFEIALSPAELGRVEMVLQDSDNRLTLTVFAERPETMDLIRRNLGLLAQEMRDLGFAGLSLQLGGQGDRPAQDRNTRADLPLAAGAPEPGAAPTARRLAPELTTDHLDLRL